MAVGEERRKFRQFISTTYMHTYTRYLNSVSKLTEYAHFRRKEKYDLEPANPRLRTWTVLTSVATLVTMINPKWCVHLLQQFTYFSGSLTSCPVLCSHTTLATPSYLPMLHTLRDPTRYARLPFLRYKITVVSLLCSVQPKRTDYCHWQFRPISMI